MAATAPSRPRRMSAALREEARVTPLELFFDLVFVLALTQCTALMADQPTWEGLAKGMLVLGVMWWAWVGYAWLTSVIDPEEGAVRLVIFAAMAGLLIVALCVPGAFDGDALLFAGAYGVVRFAHLALFFSPAATTRCCATPSSTGLAVSTAVGIGAARRRVVRSTACRRARVGAGARDRHGRAAAVRPGGLEARARRTSPSATG